MSFKPEVANLKLEFNGVLSYDVTDNDPEGGQLFATNANWDQSSNNQPIYINVEGNRNLLVNQASPSPILTVPELELLVILLLVFSILSIAIILRIKKQRDKPN